jgi:hypothetical protein
MCFYNDDYDWIAEEHDERMIVLETAAKCYECRRVIEPGEPIYRISQQEHECCQICENGDCECSRDDDDECMGCQCETPGFGETFECDICLECVKLRAAIAETERLEGCPPGTREPGYGEVADSLSQFKREDALRYFRQAAKMYPGLRGGYLKRMWGKMFSRHGRAGRKSGEMSNEQVLRTLERMLISFHLTTEERSALSCGITVVKDWIARANIRPTIGRLEAAEGERP